MDVQAGHDGAGEHGADAEKGFERFLKRGAVKTGDSCR